MGLLAIFVPTLVELAFELRDPFLWHMVRRMGRAGRIIQKEGSIGRDGFLLPDVANSVIGERIVERVSTFHALRNLHRDQSVATIERRLPLVHLAPDEAIEVIEA